MQVLAIQPAVEILKLNLKTNWCKTPKFAICLSFFSLSLSLSLYIYIYIYIYLQCTALQVTTGPSTQRVLKISRAVTTGDAKRGDERWKAMRSSGLSVRVLTSGVKVKAKGGQARLKWKRTINKLRTRRTSYGCRASPYWPDSTAVWHLPILSVCFHHRGRFSVLRAAAIPAAAAEAQCSYRLRWIIFLVIVSLRCKRWCVARVCFEYVLYVL